jgi:polar amino acid transport system substrate-binding protein
LIQGLQRGNYDLAINGLEVTEDRKTQINFSIPYYSTSLQLSVRASDDKIKSLADLKGKVVGTLKYSLAQRVLEREGGIRIRTYDGLINAYQDLAFGRTDAVFNDYPIAVYYSKPNPKLKFAGEPVEEVLYAIGIRKEDEKLREEVNAALVELIKAGVNSGPFTKSGGFGTSRPDVLFSQMISQPKALEDFTRAVTEERSLKDRLKQYLSYVPILLLQGAPMTLLISLLGMALAIVLGLVLALANLYGPAPISFASKAFIEVFRGTPLLIQLYLIFLWVAEYRHSPVTDCRGGSRSGTQLCCL